MPVIRHLVTLIAFLAIYTSAQAATSQQIDIARAKGLAWLILNQQANGSWKTVAGVELQATSYALNAMTNAGIKSGYIFGKAHSWIANAEALSTESLALQILALNKVGSNSEALTKRLMSIKNNSSGSWGAYKGYSGSFPDTSLAMRASGDSSALNFVLTAANTSDGGWPYSTGSVLTQSRLIPTANNIIALCNSNIVQQDSQVTPTINAGVNWLISQQKADGSFSDDPSTGTGSAYETALAYMAFHAAGDIGSSAVANIQNVLDKAMTFLISNQQPDGSWGSDPLQTAVVLQVLPPVALTDTDKDGTPDVVETLLNTKVNVADATGFVKASGVGITGTLPSTVTQTATQGIFFSSFLASGTGTSPFVWSIDDGSLPDGLSLSASSGLIFGTPRTAGSNFYVYKVTDANGQSTKAEILINVTANAASPYLTITSKPSLCGTITPSGQVTIAKGSDFTFTVTPNWNASLADVIVNGVSSIGNLQQNTIRNISADTTCHRRPESAATVAL